MSYYLPFGSFPFSIFQTFGRSISVLLTSALCTLYFLSHFRTSMAPSRRRSFSLHEKLSSLSQPYTIPPGFTYSLTQVPFASKGVNLVAESGLQHSEPAPKFLSLAVLSIFISPMLHRSFFRLLEPLSAPERTFSAGLSIFSENIVCKHFECAPLRGSSSTRF